MSSAEQEPEIELDISAPTLGPVEVELDATAETSVPDVEPPQIKKSETTDSKTFDRIIIGFCLLVFAVSSYLIIDERLLFNFSGDTKNLEVVAKLTRGGKDVRRRFEQDPNWFTAAAPDDVYQADSVFNGEKTDLEITFKDNTRISINPGSLVVVRKTMDGRNNLKVETGSVTASVASDKPLILESQGKELKLTGGDAKATLSVKRGEGATVSVIGGQAELKAGGQVQKLQKNQVATTDASGKIADVKNMPVELIAPQAGAQIWYSSGKSIQFKWSELKDTQYYTLQFSNSDDFKNIVFEKSLSFTQFDTQSIASNRIYYWRVLAKTKKGILESPVQQFSVKSDFGPRLILPTYDRTLKVSQKAADRSPAALDTNKPLLSVLLQWQDETGGKVFNIQVSKSENFESLVYENTLPGTSIETPKLPAGKFYWRVKVADNTRPDASWSKISTFNVGEAALEGAPKWLFPKNLQQIVVQNNKGQIRLQWEKRDGAVKYDIEIASAPDFNSKSVILSENLKSVLHDWQATQTGTYYGRVRGITSSGDVTEFSTPVRFDVVKKKTLPAPLIIKPKVKYETSLLELLYHFFVSTAQGGQGPLLEWQPVEGAAQYRIEVSKTKGFESIVNTYDVNSTNLSLPNPQPGNYFWRVRAIGPDGELGQASDPGEISVSAGPPTPYTSGTLAGQAKPEYAQTEKVDVDLKWSSSTFARSYEVQISEEPSFDGALVKKVSSNSEKFQLPKSGNYYWRVRSLGPDGEPLGRFSEMKEIQVTPSGGAIVQAPTPSAPTPSAPTTSPQTNARVTSPTTPPPALKTTSFEKTSGSLVDWSMPKDKIWTNRESVSFTWNKAQTIKQYQLKVYRNNPQPSSPPKLINDINTKGGSFLIERLEPGSYYATLETLKYDNSRGPSPQPLQLKVRRAKPIEFKHIDLRMTYSPRAYTLTSSVQETNTSIGGSALGGTTHLEIDSTFNNSQFGLKLSFNYNTMRFAASNILTTDHVLAASYKFDEFLEEGFIRPYFGVRVWQMPMIIPDQRQGGSSNYYEYLTPMTVGGAAGVDYQQKFSSTLGLFAQVQASSPITNSIIGTFNPSNIYFNRLALNSKAEVGVLYTPSWLDNAGFISSIGMQTDLVKWAPVNSSAPTNSESSITVSSIFGRVGLEILTDTEYHYAPKGKKKSSLFNDVELKSAFSLLNIEYHSLTNRAVSFVPPINFTNVYGTAVNLEGTAWIQDTDWGARLTGAWNQFPLQSQSAGFPETSIEIGYRPAHAIYSGFELSSFFGARYWSMLAIELQGGSGTQYMLYNNGLLGPQGTLKMAYKFSDRLKIELLGQGSLPLITTSARTYIGETNWKFGSYRYEGNVKFGFTPDFSIGASYGVRYDEYRYLSRDKVTPSDSYITLKSPITSFFMTYDF